MSLTARGKLRFAQRRGKWQLAVQSCPPDLGSSRGVAAGKAEHHPNRAVVGSLCSGIIRSA